MIKELGIPIVLIARDTLLHVQETKKDFFPAKRGVQTSGQRFHKKHTVPTPTHTLTKTHTANTTDFANVFSYPKDSEGYKVQGDSMDRFVQQ